MTHPANPKKPKRTASTHRATLCLRMSLTVIRIAIIMTINEMNNGEAYHGVGSRIAFSGWTSLMIDMESTSFLPPIVAP